MNTINLIKGESIVIYFNLIGDILALSLIIYVIIKIDKAYNDTKYLYVQYNVSNTRKHIIMQNDDILFVKSSHIDIPFKDTKNRKDSLNYILKGLADIFPLEKKYYTIEVKKGLVLITLKDVGPGIYCLKKNYIYVKVEAPKFSNFKLKLVKLICNDTPEKEYRDLDGIVDFSNIESTKCGKYLMSDINAIVEKRKVELNDNIVISKLNPFIIATLLSDKLFKEKFGEDKTPLSIFSLGSYSCSNEFKEFIEHVKECGDITSEKDIKEIMRYLKKRSYFNITDKPSFVHRDTEASEDQDLEYFKNLLMSEPIIIRDSKEGNYYICFLSSKINDGLYGDIVKYATFSSGPREVLMDGSLTTLV